MGMLTGSNKLPSGFSARDEYGNDYKIILRVSGTAPNWQIDAAVVTSGAVKRGDEPSLEDAGTAAAILGADGGVVRLAEAEDVAIAAAESPARAIVNGGIYAFGSATPGKLSWAWRASDWMLTFSTEGQLVARTGYQSTTWSSYLRRDGTLPMTGNLDMGSNTIKGLKSINMGDYCDGGVGAPTSTDYTGSTASTMDGQLATCRIIASYTEAGVEGDRARWAKATPGYATYSDAAFGSMDGAMSAPMYLFTNIDEPTSTPRWTTIRMMLKWVPTNFASGIGPAGQVATPTGYSPIYDKTKRNGVGGEVVAIFVKETAPGVMQWVGDIYRASEWDGSPVRWAFTDRVYIPGTRNTGGDEVVSTALDPDPANNKNWVYQEWLFSSAGISQNTYASVPLFPDAARQDLKISTANRAVLDENTASVIVKDCTTTITPPDPMTGLGGGSSTSCVDIVRNVNGGTVSGGGIEGELYTPYAYSAHFQWQTNYYGRIQNALSGVWMN